jgi:hypothetical protein
MIDVAQSGGIGQLGIAATILAAQQGEKQEVSLVVQPAHITLNAGQTQQFSAHIEGAPAATVIAWAVPDRGEVVWC